MRKYGIFCLIILILAVVLPAMADSVWMPMDDYFMDTWNPESDSKCEYQERPVYMAAGADGYVVSVRTPLDPTPVATYPNGTEFRMTFMCGIGDDRWGTIYAVRLPGEKTFNVDYSGSSGYISEKDLVRAYDTDVFSELNSNSIYGFAEKFDPCDPLTPFAIWSYPNSGIQMDVVTETMLEWLCSAGYDSEYFPIEVDRIYTDKNSVRWLSVHLMKPETFGWLNLDHPMDGAVIQNFN